MKSEHLFLIQSKEKKWALCATFESKPPMAVTLAAESIIRVTPDALMVLKDKTSTEDILRHLPDLISVPRAKRLRGYFTHPDATFVLASLGREEHDKGSMRRKLAFAFVDVASGFYIGRDARDFTDVESVTTAKDGTDTFETQTNLGTWSAE